MSVGNSFSEQIVVDCDPKTAHISTVHFGSFVRLPGSSRVWLYCGNNMAVSLGGIYPYAHRLCDTEIHDASVEVLIPKRPLELEVLCR